MPSDADAELSSRVPLLERKLRSFKRNILGTSSVDKDSMQKDDVFLFEAQVSTAIQDWEKFQALFDEREEISELLGKADDFPSSSWLAIYDQLRKEIVSSKGILLLLKNRFESDTVRPQEGASLLNTTTSVSKPQLPRIPIPQFSGDMIKWTHFRDTFVSMVHNEPTLSEVEKFHYLIGALHGESAALLSRFPVEENSYQQAWQKVLQTYDNPRILARMLIDRILDCNVESYRNELQRYDAFLTSIADSIEALRTQKINDPYEFLLSTLALRGLDSGTRKEFELSLTSNKDFPSADDVISFVRHRKTALIMSTSSRAFGSSSATTHIPTRTSHPANRLQKSKTVSLYSSNPGPSDLFKDSRPRTCLKCKGDHYLFGCQEFKNLDVNKRIQLVRKAKVCWNCLRPGHRVLDCKSNFKCHTCKKRHHTLLHQDSRTNQGEQPKIQRQNPPPQAVNSTTQPSVDQAGAVVAFGASPTHINPQTVLLGTVRLLIKGDNGALHITRALLDSGSQHSFMTSSLAKTIGATISRFNGNITTLGESSISKNCIKGAVNCSIRPFKVDEEFNTLAIVVDRITSTLPNCQIPSSITDKLQEFTLADHQFAVPSPVDMLIGADLYPQLIIGAPRHSGIQDLYLLPTVFGLAVTGSMSSPPSGTTQTYFVGSEPSTIDLQLKSFWEIEEPVQVTASNPDDVFCEEHFINTHSRTADGRYIVRFPFNDDVSKLSHNRDHVSRRFRNLENKFEKDRSLAEAYSIFMKEYQEMGHMSRTTTKAPYLIPHHGVWQESSLKKKLRVVFDASCATSAKSLNDLLHSGPKLQADLCSILIRFRLYLIPICADLVKMYRQILIHPEDRRYQHIMWRSEVTDEVQEYELNTVTYGIKSSAYHALRIVKQLVVDEGENFPLAANRVNHDMYVDDLVTGADTPEEASILIGQLQGLFTKGGFTLSKWASTHHDIIPNALEPVKSLSIPSTPEDNSFKILGMMWNSFNDSFCYSARIPFTPIPTKRSMLSSVARTFDPLGLLAPVIFCAKVLIQEVWKANIGWDDQLPDDIASNWEKLTSQWQNLTTILIPRYISVNQARHTLIGFCDASMKGYAATLYLRSEGPTDEIKVALIKAKTKVAPLKFYSIPRLELCGALLLSRLVSSIPKSLTQETICFTDSQVVLAWLQTPVHTLPTFEANRVSQIQSITPASYWCHVKSEENPADLASRGCGPDQLKDAALWWHGPHWLYDPLPTWFTPSKTNITMSSVTNISNNNSEYYDYISRFSSYLTLIRTIVRIRRIAKRIRKEEATISGPITAKEFEEAEYSCIKAVQFQFLPKELLNSAAPPKSYSQLSPFIDERGIVRVGGRLHNSQLEFAEKHPILIPHQSPLSRLIILHTHNHNLHAGPSLTLALIRRKYWIPKAGKMIKGTILRCVRCRIQRAKPNVPIMASLPKERFSAFRAFTEVGVDYAGPFLIKESQRRNASLGKAYLCLFICMSSKALHLEVVSSLTTPAFLATLERFISRRGAPRTIHSDHGTNFLGASRILKDLFKFQKTIESKITDSLASRGIDWRFIPPRAPHFGGLWEAGVKSVKRLLSSTIGKQPYTFEELTTVFCKIEALLNSRPLCPLNEDAESFDFLTPAHLLHGCSSNFNPRCSQGFSALTKWRLMQDQLTNVWERWRKEYLHTLQQRTKWLRKVPNMKVGDLVILLERRSPAGHWPVARVIDTFPGRDGTIRTVSVRTPSGNVLTRAVTSLVPLHPPEEKEDNNSSLGD